MIRAKEIAHILNISPSTVSLVLNNKGGVSETTRQKVFKVMEDMGYEGSKHFKPKSKSNKCIRFIIYKKHGKVVTETPFFSALMEGIEQEARKARFHLVVSYINEGENKEELMHILGDSSVEGIILLATEMFKEDFEPFKNLQIPLVVLDNDFEMEKIDIVVIGNREGTREAAQCLVENGHLEIGYLQSSIWINNFEGRKEGLLNELSNQGRKLNQKHVINLEPTLEGAYRDMLNVLQGSPSLPTAFIADNDIIAFGALRALKENGIKVPEDISIIGFDDMPFCEMSEPPLTTVKVFKQKMGILAVRRLLDKIQDDEGEFVKVEVRTELIERRSVLKK